MANVAFLGLGVMGYPMAGHLQSAGHSVTVYNRTTAKAEAWVAEHGGAMATPQPRRHRALISSWPAWVMMMTCAVCAWGYGGICRHVQRCDFCGSHNRFGKSDRRTLCSVRGTGAKLCGCADLWGPSRRRKRRVVHHVWWDQTAYDAAEPIMAAYSRICRRIGDSGAGQKTKMCNQIAIAGLVQGLSEALHFAEKAGLDGAAVVEVISQGAAGSWQMSNRYQTMLDDHFEHGFAVDWMRKDLGICLQAADETGASLPVTALVDQFYKDVQKMGGGRWDIQPV